MAGRQAGVTGTPSFFLGFTDANGSKVKALRTLVGAQPYERFQEAIDRAAMRAGKGSSDAYIAEWRRESFSCDDEDLGRIVAAEAERIESEYSDDRLLELIRSHGTAE